MHIRKITETVKLAGHGIPTEEGLSVPTKSGLGMLDGIYIGHLRLLEFFRRVWTFFRIILCQVQSMFVTFTLLFYAFDCCLFSAIQINSYEL